MKCAAQGQHEDDDGIDHDDAGHLAAVGHFGQARVRPTVVASESKDTRDRRCEHHQVG